jgi:hypothetical protein
LRHVHSNVKLSFVVILALLVIVGCAPFSSAAPTTTLTISGPNFSTSTTYVNALTTFSLSAVDSTASPVSNIWYHWDSYNYTKYTGPFSAVVELASTGGAPALPIDLEEGPHILYYNSTNDAGQNELLINAKSVYVDNSAPTTTIQFTGAHLTGTNEFIKANTRITFSSNDTGSGVASISYKIDSNQYVKYRDSFQVTEPGQHVISYNATDKVNNMESVKTITIFVDTEAPVVQIIPQQPYITSGGIIYAKSSTLFTLDLEDSSGVAQSSYMTDYGSWTAYTTPFTVWVAGEHTIKAMATDNLGLTSAEVTITVYIDTAPPIVTINGTSGTTIEIDKGDTIELICSDSGVGRCIVHYSLDEGNSWTEYTGPIEVEEDFTITYYAEDGLGNTASEATTYVKVKSNSIWTTTNLMILWLAVGVTIIVVIFIYYRRLPDDPLKEEKKEKDKIIHEETKPKKRKMRRNN